MAKGELTVERLRELLAYDPETGIFKWLVRPARNSRRRIGDVAGTTKVIHGASYRYIGIDGKDYLGAQLAWLYAYGVWPKGRVTTVNEDPLDLRIGNLAEMPSLSASFDLRTSDGRAAYNRAHRAAHPDHYREQELKRSFGIDLAEYQRLFAEQGGVCAICSQPEASVRNSKTKWLAVDHDHATGSVRGLLCSNCNPMIGYARESIERLTQAIAYLQRHSRSADDVPANVVSLVKKDTT